MPEPCAWFAGNIGGRGRSRSFNSHPKQEFALDVLRRISWASVSGRIFSFDRREAFCTELTVIPLVNRESKHHIWGRATRSITIGRSGLFEAAVKKTFSQEP